MTEVVRVFCEGDEDLRSTTTTATTMERMAATMTAVTTTTRPSIATMWASNTTTTKATASIAITVKTMASAGMRTNQQSAINNDEVTTG